MPRGDKKAILQYRIPIPPMEVQEEVVRVLDSFAELEAELEARRRQYAYYRDQLLDFTEREDVSWLTLGEVCKSVCSGGTPSRKNSAYYGGGIPWLCTGEVDWCYISSTEQTITEEGLANSSAKWIPAGCVIVAMYGATAAKVAMNTVPLTTNQACCNLQIDNSVALTRYAYHWLCKEYEHLKALGEGSQKNINAQKVKSYPIPVPPLAEQQRIVSILDRFDALTTSLDEGLPAEIEARRKQYAYWRDKLLDFPEKPAV